MLRNLHFTFEELSQNLKNFNEVIIRDYFMFCPLKSKKSSDVREYVYKKEGDYWVLQNTAFPKKFSESKILSLIEDAIQNRYKEIYLDKKLWKEGIICRACGGDIQMRLQCFTPENIASRKKGKKS